MADYLDNVMMTPLFQMGIAGLSGQGQAAGLKQAQDYRLVNAQKQQQDVADKTQAALSNIDLNDPEALMIAANSLMKINAPAGIKLFQAAQAAKQKADNQRMMIQAMQGMSGEGGGSADALAMVGVATNSPQMMALAQMQQARENRTIDEQNRLEAEQRAIDRETAKEARKKATKIEEEIRTPTEAQGKAFGFAERMKNASSVINQIGEGVLTSPTEKTKESIPLIGNMLVSDSYQQARQAQRDWISANLRKESGAVIGESEMDLEIKKYFPVVGDSEKTIQQKQKSRLIAERGMLKQAGALGDLVESPLPVATTQPSRDELLQEAKRRGLIK